MPQKASRELDIIQRNFLWPDYREKKAYNLAEWKTVTKSKKLGRLGVRELKALNNATV